MSRRLDHQETRRALADPEDLHGRIEEILRSARIEGPRAYLRVLRDQKLWRCASSKVQDLAIAEVGDQLKESFAFVEACIFEGPGEESEAYRIAIFKHMKTGLILHLIPGGTFTMGSEDEEDDEKPPHRVTVRPFLIGREPVRCSVWDPDSADFTIADLAQDEISWNHAKNWLECRGQGLSLPSEAEWEYACRAGTTTRFFWGENFNPDYCWSHNNTDWVENIPVVTRHFEEGKWNNFGLVDMCGTIWEWCEDPWINHYENGPFTEKPREVSEYSHVLRGGSWYNHGRCCRSAYRIAHAADYDSDYLGLRVARRLSLPF